MPFNSAKWIAGMKTYDLDRRRVVMSWAGRDVVNNSPVGDPSTWQRPAPPSYRPGTYKRNHRITLNRLPKKPLITRDTTGTHTIKQMDKVIRRIKLNDTVYLSNILPYHPALEGGWSPQAPKGIYGPMLRRLRSRLRRLARERNVRQSRRR